MKQSWRIPLNVFTFPGLLASVQRFLAKYKGVKLGVSGTGPFLMFVTVNSITLTAISLPLVHLFRTIRRKS